MSTGTAIKIEPINEGNIEVIILGKRLLMSFPASFSDKNIQNIEDNVTATLVPIIP
jgi:hypothetical protein